MVGHQTPDRTGKEHHRLRSVFKGVSAKAVSQCAQKGQSGTRSHADSLCRTGVRRQGKTHNDRKEGT